jgi:Asp-tRNA(Asn)/Glu-tRNA(Gln) amidotransferase A subunit family amidase
MKTNRLLQPILQDAVDTLSTIHSGRVSCTSVVASCLKRIALADPLVHACIDVLSESAQKSAALVDDKIYRGEKLGALEGLPIVVKGNIDVDGSLTTAATAALAEWRPSSTALCVLRLQEQGAIVIAKTNLPEFALRLDAWSPLYGTCMNPHAESYSAGGSSSGTAVAIACGMAPCGLGTVSPGCIFYSAFYYI